MSHAGRINPPFKRFYLKRILDKHHQLLKLWSDPTTGKFRDHALYEFVEAVMAGTQISNDRCQQMFIQLLIPFSPQELSGLLCFSKKFTKDLMDGKANLSLLQRRVLWLIWSIVIKPSNLKNAMSILSFGRMGIRPTRKKRNLDYQI